MAEFTPNQALADAIELSGYRKGWIAKQIGVGPWTLSRWLKGESDPDPVEIKNLALLLHCDVDALVRRVDGTTPTSGSSHAPEVCALTPDSHTGRGEDLAA